MEFNRKEHYQIEDLKEIMKILRSENGCPWDKVQTHESIRKNFIEETYEVVEAIDKKDAALLREELGDVLLQVIFHSQMEEENDVFTFDDVVNDICQKLIVRHPHIFSDTEVSGVEDVLNNWADIKQQTKGQKTATETLLSVPRQLPALMRSEKVQGRAKKAGFDYPNVEMALSDLESETAELKAAIAAHDEENISEEIGDVLFSAVNVSRFYGTDPEELLTRSCDKFISRFAKVEALAEGQSIELKNASIETLLALWKEAKK